MKRLLVLLLLLTGCRTWEVNAFGVPLGEKPRYVSASSELTSEEKVGVAIVVGVAIAASVALAVAAN